MWEIEPSGVVRSEAAEGGVSSRRESKRWEDGEEHNIGGVLYMHLE